MRKSLVVLRISSIFITDGAISVTNENKTTI